MVAFYHANSCDKGRLSFLWRFRLVKQKRRNKKPLQCWIKRFLDSFFYLFFIYLNAKTRYINCSMGTGLTLRIDQKHFNDNKLFRFFSLLQYIIIHSVFLYTYKVGLCEDPRQINIYIDILNSFNEITCVDVQLVLNNISNFTQCSSRSQFLRRFRSFLTSCLLSIRN